MASPELKAMVKGAYDLQQLRMQAGLRLCANIRAKLSEDADPEAEITEEGELSEKAEKLLDKLRKSYKTLTEGVAKNRTLPAKEGFVGDELISSYAELVLINQFISLEREEQKQFRLFEGLLEDEPIYTAYLKHQRGCGPAMAGVIISVLDPHKARHVSAFWKYVGVDVLVIACEACQGTGHNADGVVCPHCDGTGNVGEGRSRRANHLVEREYTDRDGNPATRMGITFNPWAKTKLVGVMAGNFLRNASPWRVHYDNYKHRLESDPRRLKVTADAWKKLNKKHSREEMRVYWTPGRIDRAAKRYMLKMFLADLWVTWRRLEGLPVTEPYAVGKLGMMPHAAE